MDERKLTEKESLEVITSMIAKTKDRYIANASILLVWGYLVVGVALLVWVMLAATHQVVWNWLWFAIPVVGGIATPVMSRHQDRMRVVKTYTDIVTSKMWMFMGVSAMIAMVLCAIIQVFTSVNCWVTMLVYSLIAVSFAEIAQGIFIKENSLCCGGSIGLVVGILTLCCVAGGMPLGANWYMPLFIVAFIAMTIIPGHILNYKSKKK